MEFNADTKKTKLISLYKYLGTISYLTGQFNMYGLKYFCGMSVSFTSSLKPLIKKEKTDKERYKVTLKSFRIQDHFYSIMFCSVIRNGHLMLSNFNVIIFSINYLRTK